MKLKEGVSLQGLNLRMRKVLITAEAVWKRNGQELVITSGTEETDKHWAGSLHRFGYALDFRTYYFADDGVRVRVKNELADLLGDDYKVILEFTHIHVEYNFV